MIQTSTFALIAVAIIAPTSRKAARPAKRRHDSHDAKTISATTRTPTTRSPLGPPPNTPADDVVEQPEGDEEGERGRDARRGDQSKTALSMRKVLALNRYSTAKRAKPVSQVE
jgi:hypothetical protein